MIEFIEWTFSGIDSGVYTASWYWSGVGACLLTLWLIGSICYHCLGYRMYGPEFIFGIFILIYPWVAWWLVVGITTLVIAFMLFAYFRGWLQDNHNKGISDLLWSWSNPCKWFNVRLKIERR